MSFVESKRRRVLVGQVAAGESLRDALLHAAREHDITTAWVSGVGALRSVELDFTGTSERRSFTGPLELLHLEGNLSSAEGELHLEARVELARPTDNGIVVVGGRLVDAVALSVELRLECMDDLGLRRERDAETGLLLWPDASPKAPKRPASLSSSADDAPSDWAAAAEASSAKDLAVERRREPKRAPVPLPFEAPTPARGAADAEESSFIPERGDYVDHKQFGLCRVDQVSDDGGLLLRLETGRRKLIKLDFLEVLEPRMDDKKRIFPLRPRRK